MFSSNLNTVWTRLSGVRSFVFVARTELPAGGGWNGRGEGSVVVDKSGANVLIYREDGSWESDEGKKFEFSNVYKWLLDSEAEHIRLEHLRFGAERPIYLFDMAAQNDRLLESIRPHKCGADEYCLTISGDDEKEIDLRWSVRGPNKDTLIHYRYE